MGFRVQQDLLFVQAPTPNSEEETIFLKMMARMKKDESPSPI